MHWMSVKYGIFKSKTRATQSVAYPLALKLDPVTLTFDLENQ
jgi:hypothetical protein